MYLYYEPVFLPAWGKRHLLSHAYNRIANRLRIVHTRKVATLVGFRSPILWIYDPLASAAVGLFGEKLVVYSVIDNYDAYFANGEIWADWVRRSHRYLMRRADVVFAVSQSLLDQCLQYNRNSYLVPNGVSFELFEAALRNDSVPSDIRLIPRPIVGYAGVVHSVIDLDLLSRTAQEHPRWSLTIVGPVEGLTSGDLAAFERLCSRANVYYLGPKSPEELPDYVKCFDVALMPYRIDQLTAHIDSLKLYEYMACGKPVVSTAIPSARRFVPLIEIADDPASFVRAVERILNEPHGYREARIELARGNSWGRRINEMGEILGGHLRARKAPITVPTAQEDCEIRT